MITIDWRWIVACVIIVGYSSWKLYQLGVKIGYKIGAEYVLKEWKKTMKEGEK